jgi:hypothetical protein
MSMADWVVTSYVDPQFGRTWVYKASPHFHNVHFSFSVDNPNRSHTALDDRTAYYFGVTGTYNNSNLPEATKTLLLNAYRDYYTVR